MKHDPLHRGLVWGLAATLLLPMVIAVMLGTAALLAAVGDDLAAAVCRWSAVPLAVIWGAALAATTALSAASQLTASRRPRRRRRRRVRRAVG